MEPDFRKAAGRFESASGACLHHLMAGAGYNSGLALRLFGPTAATCHEIPTKHRNKLKPAVRTDAPIRKEKSHGATRTTLAKTADGLTACIRAHPARNHNSAQRNAHVLINANKQRPHNLLKLRQRRHPIALPTARTDGRSNRPRRTKLSSATAAAVNPASSMPGWTQNRPQRRFHPSVASRHTPAPKTR